MASGGISHHEGRTESTGLLLPLPQPGPPSLCSCPLAFLSHMPACPWSPSHNQGEHHSLEGTPSFLRGWRWPSVRSRPPVTLFQKLRPSSPTGWGGPVTTSLTPRHLLTPPKPAAAVTHLGTQEVGYSFTGFPFTD